MSTKPTQEAYKRLVKGLTQLDFKDYYVPSELALVGDAFPLAINSQGQVLMAASTYGLGRIVVLGHEACLSEFPSLVENAVNWLRGDGSANLSVAVHQNIKAAADELCQYKFTVKVVGGFRSDLGVGVYVTDAYSVAADQKSLVTFMKSGGGILIGGQAWHWSSKNPGVEPLLNFDGNKVSGVAGIYFTEKFRKMETLSISPEVPYSWMSLKPARDFNDDLNFLLKGVKELDVGSPSTFSEILPHGSLAFPIGTTEDGRPFLAGAYYGLGRVLVISHEGCLSNQNLSTFWSNAIRWLDQGRNGVVGVVEKRAVPVLSKSGFTCEYTDFRKDLSVYMGMAYSDAHAKEIQDFVAEGGGLVIGGHAWYWSYGGGNVMTEFPGNKILNKMGLSLLGDTIDGGIYKVPESSQAIVDNYHFRHMLSQFAGHVLEEKALSQSQTESFQKLSSHCANFLQMRAYGCSSYMQVLLALYDLIVKAGVPQVSESNPVKSPKDRLLLFMGSEMYKAFPDPDVLLPHLIKDIPTLPVVNSQRIKINVDTADLSTFTMSTKPTQEAYKRLVKGLTQLDFKDYYVPSELALVGDAFPLAINSQGQVLMAASTYGLGRIVVLGHEACLSEFPSLVENAVNWLRGDGSANLSVAVHQNIKAAADELCQYKFTVKVVGGFRSDLGVGVYVTDAYSVAADQKSLVTFMKSGGGILIGGQAWHWSSKNPGVEPLLNFDGNKVSGVAGIYFTEKFRKMETLSISPEVPYSWMSLKPARDFNDDLNFLLKGVKELDVGSPSTFSEILPHGSLAFPIGTTEDGRPFLAGAYYGLGRVLVISHEGCLSNQNLSTFWSNAIRWLDQGRNGVVGVVEKRAVPVLSKSGFTCEYTDFRKDLSVYMGMAYSDAHAKEIQDFVAEGGGLVIGGHAWYWSYGGGNVMTEFPGNKILNKMGLSLLGDTIDGGIYKVPESSQAIVDNYHFRHMLSQFAGHVLEEKALSQSQTESFQKLSSHCANFLQMRAYGCSSYMQVLLTLYDLIVKAGVPQVSESNPVKSPKDRLLLFMGSEMYKAFPDPDVLLPHLIKDIPTLPVVNSQRIKINVDTADLSTFTMSTKPTQEAYKRLVKGLTQLDFKDYYVPSELALVGDAFPLAINSQGQVLMAASTYGLGRIVVLGHEACLSEFPSLVENAVNWLRGDGSANLSVAVHQNIKAAADELCQYKFTVKVVGGFRSDLGVGVYVTDAYSVAADQKSLVTFMKSGGGILIGGQAWHWSSKNPGVEPLLNFDGNKVSGVAGIYFTEKFRKMETLSISPEVPYSWMSLKPARDFNDDLNFLLKGVKELDVGSPSTFSEILPHGSLAFPIGTTEDGRPFLAGAYYGLGRVLVISHEGCLSNQNLSTFWSNAIRWLDQGRNGVVGVVEKRAVPVLSKSGFTCEYTDFRKDLSVYMGMAYSDAHAKEIQDFVAEGGGLVIGGHAWYWSYGGGNVMTEFPGNKILNKMGLSLLGDTIDGGIYKVPESSQAIVDNYHFRHMLSQFAGHVLEEKALSQSQTESFQKLSSHCANFLQMRAYGCSSYMQVLLALYDLIVKAGVPQVSESNPVKSPKDRLLLFMGSEMYKAFPDPDVLLPHLIKDIPTLPVVNSQRIKINVDTADLSTFTMSTKPTQEAYKRLVKGLTQLDFKDYYVPSELALVGDAFPLAINSQGQVLMAASTYGLGRIVVLGHEACLSEFPSLVENAVNWLRGDGSANLSVAVHQNIKAAADELCQYKFTVKVVGGFRSDLGVGVYVTDAYSVAADQKSLVTFMKSGGGILIGGQAWHWSSKNPGVEPLLNFDGNKVSGVAGIYFTEKFRKMETLSISPEVPYSWMSLKPARDFNDDLNFLLKGVKELDVGSPSTFSEILPHGSLAFPIGTTEDGRPFLAGAYYGLGRVLVISHEGCLSNQNLSTFWSNAIRWLDQGRNGVVGVVEKRAVPVLSKSGFTCEYTDFRKDLSVYMGMAYSDAHAKEIQDFVAEGGGLVIGGHAWYWSYGGGNVMTEFPGNKILNKMGLSLLGDTIDGGIYKVPESSQAIVDNYHFRHMLSQFAGHVLEEKALSQSQTESFQKLSSHCANFLQMRAYGCSSYMQVLLALYDLIVKAGVPQVSESNPVKSPKDRLLLFMGSEMYKAFPDPDVLLPHLIKDIPTLPVVNSQRIKINVDTAR